MSAELIQAIAVTGELTGTQLSEAAARMMMADLSEYDERAVIAALARCRRELKGRLTLAEIIARIDDGRPGVEEAWAMLPRDEYKTVVWTDEMTQAWSVALPLLDEGDEVAARMAFKEAYTRIVTTARSERKRPVWSASLGHDPRGRESALMDAVQKGRLSANAAKSMLPYHEPSPQWIALLEKASSKLLGVSPSSGIRVGANLEIDKDGEC